MDHNIEAGDTMKCFKCGVEEGELHDTSKGITKAVLIKHHTSYNPENIVDCCISCHQKIHTRLRRNNSCPLSLSEIDKLSQRSSQIRYMQKNTQTISFRDTLIPFVLLREEIVYNNRTGNVYIDSGFEPSNNKHLWIEEI
jgi:hypothetical protein